MVNGNQWDSLDDWSVVDDRGGRVGDGMRGGLQDERGGMNNRRGVNCVNHWRGVNSVNHRRSVNGMNDRRAMVHNLAALRDCGLGSDHGHGVNYGCSVNHRGLV